MKRFALALAIVFWSGAGQAAGWTGRIKVVAVFTEATTDMVVFYTTGGSVYAPGCVANDWIFTGTTDARLARGYAALLSALHTGADVQVWFSDTCATWAYHNATSIQVDVP
jgi:hypothetical protein